MPVNENPSEKVLGTLDRFKNILLKVTRNIWLAEPYVYSIARTMNFGHFGERLKSDSAKLICAQMGKKVADRAIQVLGGYGYVGEYHVERLWRDAKLLEIGGGTNEALEKNITKELKTAQL